MRIFIATTLLVLVNFFEGFSQERFQRVYGGDGYDVGVEIIQADDDGYYIAGSSGSFDSDLSNQILLLKTDEFGDVLWRKTYGGELSDWAESMVESADGGLLIAGYKETYNNSYQFYALKLTLEGDIVWNREYGGPLWDLCYQAVALPDGGFALFGQTYNYGMGEGDYYLVRIDSEGDTLWTKTYGGADDDNGQAISLTNEGGFYLVGYTESFGAGKKDGYIVKTDAIGDTIWTRTFGGEEDEYVYGGCTTFNGAIVAVGGSYSNTPGESDFMIHKMNINGVSVNNLVVDGSSDEFWTDVAEDADSNLIFCGYVHDSQFGKIDGRYERYTTGILFDDVGASVGTSDNDKLFDVKPTSDNGYVMVGTTEGFLFRFEDIYVRKMDHDGVSSDFEVGVEEISVGSETFKVRLVPNPVADVTDLVISDYQTVSQYYYDQLTLRIYDAIGHLVLEQPVVSAKEPVEMSGLSAGFHVYQLLSGNQVLATGRLVKTGR